MAKTLKRYPNNHFPNPLTILGWAAVAVRLLPLLPLLLSLSFTLVLAQPKRDFRFCLLYTSPSPRD